MNLEEQTSAFQGFTDKMEVVLMSKGYDYANQDRLSNFKEVASITQSTPEKVALTLIAIKVARLGVLLDSDKSPNNESVEDSVLDLANYAFLLHAILIESFLNKKAYDNEPM